MELVDAHWDLKAPLYTLFKHANLYRAIPYYFPTAVKFTAANTLFNALLNKK